MVMIKIVVLLCCGLGVLASPPGPANINAADDEPDLLQMLDYFKGKSDMSLLVNFLKQAKIATAIGESLFDICPGCKQVFETAAKTNVAFRILEKVIEGHAPDLRDMYDLAIKGTGDIAGSFSEAQRKNKKFNALVQALLSSSTKSLSSASQIEQDMNLFTGRTFTLDPALVKGVYEANVEVTRNNVVEVNLLQMMSSWKNNFALFNQLIYGMMKLPPDFVGLLPIIYDFDFSNLSKIKIITGGMNNGKYTVAGGKPTFETDPDVVKMMQDHQEIHQMLKTKSQDQASAESLLLDTIVEYMKITTLIIKAAEADRRLVPV